MIQRNGKNVGWDDGCRNDSDLPAEIKTDGFPNDFPNELIEDYCSSRTHYGLVTSNSYQILGAAHDSLEIIVLLQKFKSPEKIRRYLKMKVRKGELLRVEANELFSKIEILRSDVELEKKEWTNYVEELKLIKGDDNAEYIYKKNQSKNQIIGLFVSGVVVIASFSATSFVLAREIAFRLGSDNMVVGIAALIPLACSGVIIKHLVTHHSIKPWSVFVTWLAMVLYLVSLPVFYLEIAKHWLNAQSSLLGGMLHHGASIGSSQGGKELLYGAAMLIEVLSSFFASDLWQRLSDKPRNPEYDTIKKEMRPIRRRIQKLQSKLGRLIARRDQIIRKIERVDAVQNAIKKLFDKLFR